MNSGGVLVICAHRDDETLGCGGTLATTGGVVCALGGVPRGNDTIYAHWSDAAKTLGAAMEWPYDFGLELPDQRFDTVSLLEVAQGIERFLEKYRPHTIYTHHAGDLNRDHRIVHEAVLVATRPTPGQTVKRVYSFEVPSSTEWHFGGGQPFVPNVFQPLTRVALDCKLAAMACYETETRAAPHPRSPESLEAIARRWGSVCGHEYAEAFMLVREIRE